jgi:DNA polymerase type B, organellar and viral
MDNAVKYGYTFEIIKGYQFEQGDLFSGYVNKMYGLRNEYVKGHPMNLIAKLLLNSLYGKFGMKVESTTVDIFNLNRDKDKLALKKLLETVGESIQDHIELGENQYLFVRNTLSNILEEDSYHGTDVNIAIASTVTAGARIQMSYFKNNPNFNLYYSDTDSAVIDQQLPESMVGKELGLVKLEHAIKKAVFLAPKVYGFVDANGNETIKIKGVTEEVTSNLSVGDLENLLVLDNNRIFNQHKWYKNLMSGSITINDVLYNLKVTSNKRSAVYVQGVFNNTEPLNYKEIEK